VRDLCVPQSPHQNQQDADGTNRPGRGQPGKESVQNWMMCCDPRSPNEGNGENAFAAMSFSSNAANEGAHGANAPPKGERAGVGIILALNPDNSLYVHTVCPGSSAERHLFPDDVLMRIGKEDVYRAPAPFVAELLLGPPGSELEAWVRRKNPSGDPPFTTHCVKMVRRRTDPEMARKSIRDAFEEKSLSRGSSGTPTSARGIRSPGSAR